MDDELFASLLVSKLDSREARRQGEGGERILERSNKISNKCSGRQRHGHHSATE